MCWELEPDGQCFIIICSDGGEQTDSNAVFDGNANHVVFDGNANHVFGRIVTGMAKQNY